MQNNFCNTNILKNMQNLHSVVSFTIWLTISNGNPKNLNWLTVNYCQPNLRLWLTVSNGKPNFENWLTVNYC